MRPSLLFSCTILSALALAGACKKSNSGSGGGGQVNDSTFVDPGSGATVTTVAGLHDEWGASPPTIVAADHQGNVFVSGWTSEIQKIDAQGNMTTVIGNGSNPGCEDGTGTAATLTEVSGMTVDANNNIYLVDHMCSGPKKVSPAWVLASVDYSQSTTNPVDVGRDAIAVDNSGNIFVADELGEEGIVLVHEGQQAALFAGNGQSGVKDGALLQAGFFGPTSMAFDGSGNLWMCDSHRLREISNGQVTTVAGSDQLGASDGKGSAATFGGVFYLCLGPDGNLWISDTYNNSIRKASTDGTVTTVINGSDMGNSSFNQPCGIAFDTSGNLWVCDYGNKTVRKITFKK